MPCGCASVEPQHSRRTILALGAGLVAAPAFAADKQVITPNMRLARPGGDAPRVALTFDACPGSFDPRVATALVDADTPASVFVCGAWMRRNSQALAYLLDHPKIFSLQNHGAQHHTCVLREEWIWGLRPAVSIADVQAEVAGGARMIYEAAGKRPTWFRGAGALYSLEALEPIRRLGFGIGAFSVNADGGATLPAGVVTDRLAEAPGGSVTIAHINQPFRLSGAGVAAGLADLKRRGAHFLRLDALTPEDVIYS